MVGAWRDAHTSFVVDTWTAQQVSPGVVRLEAKGRLTSLGASHAITYTVFGDGRLLVEPSMTAPPGTPDLPRFGMQATLVAGLEQVTWYGPGPEETYADRRDRPVGVYRTTVRANYFRYSQPQETGNKVDVRWAADTTADGAGLLAIGQSRLSVNALHHPAAEIDQAGHHHQLRAPSGRCATRGGTSSASAPPTSGGTGRPSGATPRPRERAHRLGLLPRA